MTTTKPDRRRPGSYRDELDRLSLAGQRRADARRIAVVCGVMLIGSFPARTPLEDVIAAVPTLDRLPWPRCFYRAWSWDEAREDISLWRSGRLLALISRDAAGELVVRRFD